jgi:hypothetical protein
MQKPTIKKMRSKKSKNASNKKNMRSKKTKKNNQRGGFPFGKSKKSTKLNTSEEYRKFTDSAKTVSDLTVEDIYDDITDDMVKVFIDNFIIIKRNLDGDYVDKNNIVLQNIKHIAGMIHHLFLYDNKAKIGSDTGVTTANKNITYEYGNNSEEDQFNLMIQSLEKNYCVLRYILNDDNLNKKEKENLKKIKFLAKALDMQLDKDPRSKSLRKNATMINEDINKDL